MRHIESTPGCSPTWCCLAWTVQHLCSALARQGRAPVIVFSGYPIDAEDGRLTGVAYRLQKPVGVERLAQVIHRTLAAPRR